MSQSANRVRMNWTELMGQHRNEQMGVAARLLVTEDGAQSKLRLQASEHRFEVVEHELSAPQLL
jgi:hypothetical protein